MADHADIDHTIHKTGTKRMFDVAWMERLSRTSPLVPLFVYVPLIIALWVLSLTQWGTSVGQLVGFTAAGIAAWTLTEYILHRTLFHWERFPKMYEFLHGIHHSYPNDLDRVVMPPTASLTAAVVFFGLSLLLFGWTTGMPFFSGFVVGYLWYDMTHYWTHIAKPTSKWGKTLHHNHMVHHFSRPDALYGVSTPMWDYVFGTHVKKGAHNKKKKKAAEVQIKKAA